MESIKEVLIRRDGMTPQEAEEMIAEARQALLDYMAEGNFMDAENICEDYFGLEPDYLFELMP